MNFIKSKQGILSIIVVIVSLIFLSPFIKNIWDVKMVSVEKENIERQKIINFQKEWNTNLPELKKKIENNEFTELAPKSKWERIMIPYAELLPEMPDEKENNSTLLGIDINNNGVRDDLEILIVKGFGMDRDVVEVVFASVRSYDYNSYIYIKDLVSWNSIEEHIKKSAVSSCYYWMTDNFDREKIYNEYHNTPERKKVEKAIIKGLGGHIDRGREITEEFCEKGVEESKTWMYRNK